VLFALKITIAGPWWRGVGEWLGGGKDPRGVKGQSSRFFSFGGGGFRIPVCGPSGGLEKGRGRARITRSLGNCKSGSRVANLIFVKHCIRGKVL